MNIKRINILTLIPHVSNRGLMFCATVLWTFAGGMLLTRGIMGIVEFPANLLLKLIIAFVFGVLFYLFLFSEISDKHIARIGSMSEKRIPFYAFFNLRSYFMMVLMISVGIMVRKTGLIPFEYLAVFYIVMGIPLFVSALKFLYYAVNFNKKTLQS